jgi:hypothetical protein
MPKLHHALFTLALAGVLSTLAAPGTAQQARPQGPCDIYAAAGTPCVTAHSTVRSLSSRPVAGLRENVTLFTSSKAYALVNGLQVWGTGTVDLAAQVVHIKGYSA